MLEGLMLWTVISSFDHLFLLQFRHIPYLPQNQLWSFHSCFVHVMSWIKCCLWYYYLIPSTAFGLSRLCTLFCSRVLPTVWDLNLSKLPFLDLDTGTGEPGTDTGNCPFLLTSGYELYQSSLIEQSIVANYVSDINFLYWCSMVDYCGTKMY